MMVINVGFDYDEPLYPWFDLAHQASVRAGIALPEHEPTSWRPYEHYGCTQEEWIKVLDAEVYNPEGMYLQPLKPGVVDDVKRLYSRGYRIHIITARGSFGDNQETRAKIRRLTKTSIIRAGLPYHTLTFAKDKVEVCKRLDIHYMLDDAPHNFNPLIDAGVNAFLLDERWNQDVPEKFYPHGRRLASTKDYVNMVMNIEQVERDTHVPMVEKWKH